MAVGLEVGEDHWEVGASSFLHCFFSTVAARLEPAGWGSRFPVVMGDLYAGELIAGRAATALEELHTIRAELRAHPPADVVWDYGDRARRPPWGDRIHESITDLGTYFTTSAGRDLFEVLGEAVGLAARSGAALRVA